MDNVDSLSSMDSANRRLQSLHQKGACSGPEQLPRKDNVPHHLHSELPAGADLVRLLTDSSTPRLRHEDMHAESEISERGDLVMDKAACLRARYERKRRREHDGAQIVS